MIAEEFSKFVAGQQPTEEESKIDWAEQRDEWLQDLDSFHRRIVEYLRDYIEAGSISYRYIEVGLTEENIGRYSAKQMEIRIGRQLVYLEPIGTLLVGCKGRVDAVGSAGRAQILLVNAKVKRATDLISVTAGARGTSVLPPPPPRQPTSWAWKIVTNTTPREFVDLDKEPFLELLMEIANG